MMMMMYDKRTQNANTEIDSSVWYYQIISE